MLAGLVKAPSRLAPTVNLEGRARRGRSWSSAAMVEAGFIDKADGRRRRARRGWRCDRIKPLPDGTYFADWVLPEARDHAGEIVTETTVKTTLDRRLQRAAERAVQRAGLRQAQIAMVAMRPDGRVVAMVGGKILCRQPVQPRDAGAPPAGLGVQAVRLSRGAARRDDARFDDRRRAGHDRRLVARRTATAAIEGPITLRQAFANRAMSRRRG